MEQFEPLSIDSDIVRERDDRYLDGGNFFGTERVGFLPLEPLPDPPEPVAPAVKPAVKPAPTLVKLPANPKRKSPTAAMDTGA